MRRVFMLAVLLLSSLAAFGQGAAPKQAIPFGLRVGPESWTATEETLAARPCDEANPLGVTLVLPEPWTQAPDWTAFEAAASAVRKAHALLGVSTRLPYPPTDPRSLDYLSALSEHAESATTLALSLGPEAWKNALEGDPSSVALLFKRLTAALRGKSHATVLLGELSVESLRGLEPLYASDFRAYVDGYCAQATDAMGQADGEVVSFVESHHLGAPFLLHLPKVDTPIGAQLLILLAANRGVSFTDIETTSPATLWPGLLLLRSRLSPSMGEGFSVRATEIRDAAGPRPDVGMMNFLDADRMVQAMALVPAIATSKPASLELHLPTADVTDPVAYALPDGKAQDLGYTADQKTGETVIKIPWQGKALLLTFSRLKTGTVGSDKISVTETYRLPVEIILARYQAALQPEEEFLDNYTADAQVDYHFKLPGGTGSLDVTFLNTFFFQKGVGARWVQNKLLVNGVAWKGKTIPDLPIVEPEKVNTLPLALTLGRDYAYKYLRDETAEGRDCYVLEFIPLPGARGSLYSGRVWIDKATYVKVKMSVRQTGLEPPQVSNDETHAYTPVQGPDGRTYHILTALAGQQIFSLAGVNVVSERKILFTNVKANNPGFEPALQSAENGDRPMLQDTAQGLRYLKKQADGTRTVEVEPRTGRWLAVAGTYYDKSLDYPLPLVGANYLNYDVKKSKAQVNLFLAGAVNTLTFAKVDLFPKVDADANAVLFAIPFQDRFYPAGTEEQGQRVKILREFANGGLGWRFTEFSKLSLDLGAIYYHYSRDSKTSPAFTLPQNHFDLSGALTYSWARRGWTLSTEYEAHHRTAWEPWGLPGAASDISPFANYELWDFAASKAFYLPAFQKITTSVTWMDGKDLDRFSQYQFSYLGRDSLSGFAGSGVRFNRGAVARVGYDFNLASVIRFGLRLDQGHVQPSKAAGLWQNHTGLGLNGAVTGPWQTYWTLDLGYALRSDIAPVRHEYTAALVVLKLW